MVLNMSKREGKLSLRPEPPNVQQIVEDIQQTEANDVAFSILSEEDQERTTSPELLNESVFSCDGPIQSPSPPGTSLQTAGLGLQAAAEDTSLLDIDTLYTQATQFLEVTKQLKQAPDLLAGQCEHLQTVGKELTESLDALRKQSDAVLKAHRSKSDPR